MELNQSEETDSMAVCKQYENKNAVKIAAEYKAWYM